MGRWWGSLEKGLKQGTFSAEAESKEVLGD